MRQLRSYEKIDVPLSTKVSLRVYPDSQPHILQTTNIQKGGVLVFRENELVEEGIGLGAPVCLYRDGARFSLSAATYVDESNPLIVKIFNMNAIESKRFRHFIVRQGSFAFHFLRILEKAYQGSRRLHDEATMMLELTSFMGLRNEYIASGSKGEISVSYAPSLTGLRVNVDFRKLVTDGLQAIIIGNEMGGRLFTEYNDSSGRRLKGRQIEPWRPIRVEWASLRSPKFGFGFRLRRPDGWLMVRGREVVDNRISWSGINLMYNGIPTSRTLDYTIEILGDT